MVTWFMIVMFVSPNTGHPFEWVLPAVNSTLTHYSSREECEQDIGGAYKRVVPDDGKKFYIGIVCLSGSLIPGERK